MQSSGLLYGGREALVNEKEVSDVVAALGQLEAQFTRAL